MSYKDNRIYFLQGRLDYAEKIRELGGCFNINDTVAEDIQKYKKRIKELKEKEDAKNTSN